jgi:hypothetical protein
MASVVVALLAVLAAPSSRAGSQADSSLLPLARLNITADMDSTAVFLDGTFAGFTPCMIDSVPPGSHKLLGISRTGASWYATPDSVTVVLFPGEFRQVVFWVASPLRIETAAVPEVFPVLRGADGSGGRDVAIYICGGVAVAAGIATAYLKISADERNEAYLATGHMPYLDQRRRLDTAAGIAFAVTQVGFFLFSYLLQTE